MKYFYVSFLVNTVLNNQVLLPNPYKNSCQMGTNAKIPVQIDWIIQSIL